MLFYDGLLYSNANKANDQANIRNCSNYHGGINYP